MKKYIFILISIFAFGACSDFLDRPPKGEGQDEPDFWTNETTVRAFANKFYDLFLGFGNGQTYGDFYFPGLDDNKLNSGGPAQLTNVPPVTAAFGTWDFTYIRKANLLLTRVPNVPMSDEAKRHWSAYARLFRAWEYFRFVKTYGDVPWYDTYIPEDDPALYKARDSRLVVMDKVLDDFDYAITNLRENDGTNRINKDVARAMKSRACLFEGTYRKYRNLADADKFLKASRDASLELMPSPLGTSTKYGLNAEYKTAYTSVNLDNNKEMILYKKYAASVLMHSTMGFLISSTTISGLNKFAVESYLCTNGKPITGNPLYMGDDNIQKVIANRDKRLAATIDTTSYAYDGAPYEGTTSTSGYKVNKFVCKELASANWIAPNNYSDAPIFWLAEIYLNYAEARAELNELNQTDLNYTINLLRARGGVDPLNISAVPDDPKRDSDVTPLIWEIRRERQVELMYDGFRQWDLYRWKKGDKLTVKVDFTVHINPVDSTKHATYNAITDLATIDMQRGAKVTPNKKVVVDPDGYIVMEGTRKFEEKHYLEPIPTGQFTLYPAGVLEQNPYWN